MGKRKDEGRWKERVRDGKNEREKETESRGKGKNEKEAS